MKYKKFLTFVCIILCLFSISYVAANDVNETVMANEEARDDLITVENQNINDINYDDDNDITLNELNSSDENYDAAEEVLSSQECENILNYSENEDVLGASPPYTAYSVSVSDTTIKYGSSGSIRISINPCSGYSYAYDFYFRVYDSNNNQKISKNYYSSSSTTSITHTISANELDVGVYTIKLVNYADSKVMDTAKLIISSLPYQDYSVTVPDTIINYGSSGTITMNIDSASSNYYK